MKRVLFDHNVPHNLTPYLRTMYAVAEAQARGWEELRNGNLLQEGEAAGFDVLVTADKNINYQQNHAERTISLVVLGQGRWPLIEAYVERIIAAIDAATPGSFELVPIPLPPKKPYRQ